ncbi:transketolase [Tropicimonas sediminicola]|uniref:Transketolase n=1 Tax=Tropicimonas sediminicola TaxID=1031541 RepID=A0A239LKL6_9RHOB|nr:transketolase [Tropicimonas sediminicola]SNT31207.1 transketolase [Tropicimonas sediminicola]
MADLSRMADAIRFLSIDTFLKIGDGHPGTPLGAADIVTTLYNRHLKFDASDPTWPDRDRFVQSNGHGSMLIYAANHLAGFDKISIEEIKRFRELGSHCPGHPEYDPEAGIETTTGPLGQGIANAVGMAVAEEKLRARFGPDLCNHYIYALTGDGCLMEGISQEVIELAGHLKLGHLIFLFDSNHITDDGETCQAITEDQAARFRVAGWHTVECDGHDPASIDAAILLAKADPRPSFVTCHTVIGKGVPRIAGDRAAHGGKLVPQDAIDAREALGWSHEPHVVPDDLLLAWRAGGTRGRAERLAWQDRLDASEAEVKAEFQRLTASKLPDGWRAPLIHRKAQYAAERPNQPTVASSGEILDVLSDAIPELMSGAPDLEAATKHKRRLAPFTAQDRSGRYLHYGVREFAMGAMMNGMAAHRGVQPFGITFLVFSDYERHAIRMAAMMGLPVIFGFSHDSIGIGRNGPTHQPVEYLASLRAMPNLNVFRPADSVELAECWELALERRNGPSAVICTRQAVPTVRGDGTAENRAARGAYVIAPASGARQATLFATGSEVQIALDARKTLEARGIPTAVVSVPCWELFAAQDKGYRDEIIGRATVRVAIEAAASLGWERFIGEDGAFIGMSSFGASAPEDELFAHFGITADRAVSAVLERLDAKEEKRVPETV